MILCTHNSHCARIHGGTIHIWIQILKTKLFKRLHPTLCLRFHTHMINMTPRDANSHLARRSKLKVTQCTGRISAIRCTGVTRIGHITCNAHVPRMYICCYLILTGIANVSATMCMANSLVHVQQNIKHNLNSL